MNVYRFQCTIWVKAESAERALDHLLDEVTYHFGQDNGLLDLQALNDGVLDHEYTQALNELA